MLKTDIYYACYFNCVQTNEPTQYLLQIQFLRVEEKKRNVHISYSKPLKIANLHCFFTILDWEAYCFWWNVFGKLAILP